MNSHTLVNLFEHLRAQHIQAPAAFGKPQLPIHHLIATNISAAATPATHVLVRLNPDTNVLILWSNPVGVTALLLEVKYLQQAAEAALLLL